MNREHTRSLRGRILTDLQGINGTSVNGRRVERGAFRPQDRITIGRRTLTLKAGSP